MKKIIAIILIITTIGCIFAGCTKNEDIEQVQYESVMVDVSIIAENKSLFENRLPSNDDQNKFKESIVILIEKIEKSEITDFTVTFSDESFSSWEECNNYAEAMKPGKTHLGSVMHYYLWLAQRVINNEVKWEEICDETKLLPTIAFVEKNCWVGCCTMSCGLGYRSKSTEAFVHGPDYHAYSNHKNWQAFIVAPVE